MKIFYPAFIRLPTEKAHGIQIVKTCEALADVGAEVELVIPGRKTPIAEDVFTYYGAKKNFTITEMKTPDFVELGPLGFLFSLLWFSEMVKWQKRFWQADAVYSRDAHTLLQYVLLGRPLVYEAHNDPSFASRIVARCAKKVIVISEGLKHAYTALGVPESRIAVVPDGVDVDFFSVLPSKEEARRMLGLPKETKIALYAGRIEKGKGADTFAAASGSLPPDIRTVLVGDGSLKKHLARTYPKAVFLDARPYRDMPLIHAAADVLVLPNSGKFSESARNTSPLKLFAYMASGIPIVASDVSALREVLDDSCAYFVPPDNFEKLAEGIHAALLDPARAAKALQAREKAADFSWLKRAERVLDALF